MNAKPIIVIVDGGLVDDVLNIPPGMDVEVRDYDIEDPYDGSIALDENNRSYAVDHYSGPPLPTQINNELLIACRGYVAMLQKEIDENPDDAELLRDPLAFACAAVKKAEAANG